MRFGTIVRVQRGSSDPNTWGTGRHRYVFGVLVGARSWERFIRLLEDDPDDTVGWSKRGDVGHWGSASVWPATSKEIRGLRERGAIS